MYTKITVNQLQELKLLAEEIWFETYKDILQDDQITYMLSLFFNEEALSNYDFYFIDDQGKIGFFAYKEDSIILLSKLYIKKVYQNQGYAASVISHLKAKNKPIHLNVNKYNNALQFYIKHGFKIVGEEVVDIGKGYVMDDYKLHYENVFLTLIKDELTKPYFNKLFEKLDVIKKSEVVYPKAKDIFNALLLTPYDEVKVVILGQDPYHQPNQAHGLCFSVQEGVKLPPSLVNIFKEIEAEYGILMPNKGDLTPWAKQGVLLLNTILTVSHNKPLSHKGLGWEKFTDKIIEALQEKAFIVYILLGGHAQSYIPKITNKNHIILKSSHPSPLSNYRGFSGSNIFKKANKALIEHGLKPITWSL